MSKYFTNWELKEIAELTDVNNHNEAVIKILDIIELTVVNDKEVKELLNDYRVQMNAILKEQHKIGYMTVIAIIKREAIKHGIIQYASMVYANADQLYKQL